MTEMLSPEAFCPVAVNVCVCPDGIFSTEGETSIETSDSAVIAEVTVIVAVAVKPPAEATTSPVPFTLAVKRPA